jgi:hypothetical protein
MTPGKADKPVIVLDVGGVLVDFDLKPLFAALSKNRGEKATLPSLSNIDKLFYEGIKFQYFLSLQKR